MKGVVKLRFKDVAGNIVVCNRILQSTQKVGDCLLAVSVSEHHAYLVEKGAEGVGVRLKSSFKR